MAGFKVHSNVAAAISTSIAIGLFCYGKINIENAIFYALLGTIGGLSPDIDSAHSTSIKVVFFSLAIFCSVSIGLILNKSIPMSMLVINMVSVFLSIQFVLQGAFKKIAVHRGSCHSLAFAVLIGVMMVNILYLLKIKIETCWLAGVFLTFGCLIHLVIDEFYSFDFKNKKIKSSLGTAIKVISFNSPIVSTLQAVSIVFLLYCAPHFTLF